MKKILPYIFITLILTSFLAPFSLSLGINSPIISKNIVSADCVDVNTGDRVPPNPDGTCPAGTTGNNDNKNLTSLPSCGISVFSATIMGCVAWILYGLIFVPTSYLFGLAGNFFDFTFFYSVQDDSYRSAFVVQGWGIVRDFVNMFFIFVLLYVAFSTILGTHGAKPKEMIINVVIIGLFINFSLFVTHVIIDASNILARVFYTSSIISIKERKAGGNCAALGNCGITTNGVLQLSTLRQAPTIDTAIKPGPNGEIPLSAALVSKIDPQKLILNAKEVGVNDKGGKISKQDDIDTESFILVTLLASAVNIIGFIVFLSTGIIFISRVIGLWLACIFVPFAFFSYTVPTMAGLELVGWKNWWPDTLKQAFLAPIFIFFLYLILKFLETGLDIISADGKTGLAFVVATTVPFAFIMLLLWKAKSIANKMSGELGQGITKGIALLGGLALGATAGLTALAGRQVLGRVAAKASRMASEDAATGANAKPRGFIGQKISKLGSFINKKKEEVGAVDHARHNLDEARKAAGIDPNLPNSHLSGPDKENMRKKYIESKKEAYRQKVEEEYRKTNGLGDDYKLNSAERQYVNGEAEKKALDEFNHSLAESAKGVGMWSRAIARSNTSSYDIRNVGSGQYKEEGWKKNITTGLGMAGIATIAMAVRTGMKQGMGVNAVKPTGDFGNDMKDLLSSALSGINVKVDTGHSSGGGGGHDSGGGGHH